jgi:hypothetical protein
MINAHGHAITMVTKPIFVHSRPASRLTIHGNVHIERASKTTTGVYLFANSSINFSVGLRFAWASSTKRINFATAESSAVDVVLTSNWARPALMVPPDTRLSGDFWTGRDSPVREDSSTTDLPSMTIPSHGILSPIRRNFKTYKREKLDKPTTIKQHKMVIMLTGANRNNAPHSHIICGHVNKF